MWRSVRFGEVITKFQACRCGCFFFFNDTATTEIYTLSLHDALPISARARAGLRTTSGRRAPRHRASRRRPARRRGPRSEEHTSELQSQSNLVCRLLLEKKKISAARTREWITFSERRCTCLLITASKY